MVREMKDVPVNERPLVALSELGASVGRSEEAAAGEPIRGVVGRAPRTGYEPPAREWDAIVCHRAGDDIDFLMECLGSTEKQTVLPKETWVVTCAQGKEYAELRARAEVYGRVTTLSEPEVKCQGAKVNRALMNCEAPFFAVLDYDDTFPPEYAELLFAAWRPEVACVSPLKAKRFGDGASGELVFPLPNRAGHRLGDFSADWIRQEIAKENLFPHPCLQLRAAHEQVGGYTENPAAVQDWGMWKRYANAGWQFAVSEAWFNYRRHERNMTATQDMVARRVEAIRDSHTLAIFTPFCGRAGSVTRWKEVVANCGWPVDRLQVIVTDDSWVEGQGRNAEAGKGRSGEGQEEGQGVVPDRKFGTQLRKALTELGVSVVTYCRIAEAPPLEMTAEELASGDQHERQRRVSEVSVRVASHFERARQLCGADWLLTLEDDIRPPDWFASKLMDGIQPGVAMVGAPYLSRYENRGYLVWSVESRSPYRAKPVDPPWGMGNFTEEIWGNYTGIRAIQNVDGAGTGCALIRREALRFVTFRGFLDPCISRWGGQDIGACYDLRQHGYAIRVHWGCVARHYHDGTEYMKETTADS